MQSHIRLGQVPIISKHSLRICCDPLETLPVRDESSVKITFGFILHCTVRLGICSIVYVETHLRIPCFIAERSLPSREESLHLLAWYGWSEELKLGMR